MDEKVSATLCSGCLSVNRRLDPLSDNLELFYSLLGESLDNMKYFDVMLCWECRALLRRTRVFQKRIQHAQFILNKLQVNNLDMNCLSSLSHTRLFIQSYSEEDVPITLEVPLIVENKKEDEKEFIAEEIFYEVPVKVEDYNESENDNDEFIKEECLEDYETDKDENSSKVKDKKKRNNNNLLNQLEYWRKRYKDRIRFEELLNLEKIEMFYTELDVKKVVKDPDANVKYEDAKYRCKFCKLGFKTTYRLKSHRSNHHFKGKLQCRICSETFALKENVLRHIKDRHHLVLHCLNCKEKFTNLFNFRRHYSKYHKYYVCDYCGGSRRSKYTLVKHMRHRHGLLTKCHICKKSMKANQLQVHMKLIHKICKEEEKEQAYCVECDIQYQTLSQYKLHLKRSAKHIPRKIVRSECPECGKIFTRTNYMRNHFKLVHMKQNKNYCEICNKYYITAYALRKHKDYVHDKLKMPKDKICEVCGRGFASNRILVHHIRTHTGERPHVCACGAAFAQRTALTAHQRARHKCTPAHALER